MVIKSRLVIRINKCIFGTALHSLNIVIRKITLWHIKDNKIFGLKKKHHKTHEKHNILSVNTYTSQQV
jgi:hypothetical protein